ncbi:MAG: J domain-containing protein [Phormidesmis sp.]
MTDAFNPNASPQTAHHPVKLSYYDLLGLKSNASVQEIRRAYRDLSKLYHPDTTELDSAIAIPKFQAINEAYATLSSPEKRINYDYKTGFSRISIMQPLAKDQTAKGQKYSSNAYLDPTDRPLSAGEFFALFILGITFLACLLLVLMLSLTKGEVAAITVDSMSAPTETPKVAIPKTAIPAEIQLEANEASFTPDLPTEPWLKPK